LVLLHDSKIKGKPRKLEIAWLGPFVIEDIQPSGVVNLITLQGKLLDKFFNIGALFQLFIYLTLVLFLSILLCDDATYFGFDYDTTSLTSGIEF
jgi:hypothetical protein